MKIIPIFIHGDGNYVSLKKDKPNETPKDFRFQKKKKKQQ